MASISQNLVNEGMPNSVNEAAKGIQIASSKSKDQNLHTEDNNALFENVINSKATQCSQEDNAISNSDDFKLTIMTCVENMNSKMDFLINEVSDNKHRRLNELTMFEEALEGLNKENLKVIKENIDLQERDKYLSLIMSDLSVELKDQEQEIKSLIAAIKLLQDDNKQNKQEDRQTYHTIISS
jgi:cell division protein FtsB